MFQYETIERFRKEIPFTASAFLSITKTETHESVGLLLAFSESAKQQPGVHHGMAKKFKTLAEVEAEHILEVLTHCQWNKSHASEILGVARSTLVRKLQQLEKGGYDVHHRGRGGIPRGRRG